eukprot:CAMPEP_0201596766 /NCGR_PEP_ID=MMETSP0190_2-20130828/193377_1 /ASSEMBLY_ACC=CAM_ASM_000263 /TAXON_ID=37353 /ORGANISM="Rosalina sp." /LENGTH=135 /DNA_ID=CAMNT_0048057297 /DNA_START=972 /DNA_END=1380 /DNA_ORIENTATION=-
MNSGINKRGRMRAHNGTNSEADGDMKMNGMGYPGALGVANKSIIDEENSMNFDPNQEDYNRQKSTPLKAANTDYSIAPSATRSASVPEQSLMSEGGADGTIEHHTGHQESLMSQGQIPDIHIQILVNVMNLHMDF